MLDQDHGRAALLVHVEHVARHVLFLFLVHAGHRFIEQEHFRLQRERPSELDALLQAIGERAGGKLAQVLELEELEQVLDLLAVRDLFLLRQAPVHERGEDARAHAHVPAEHEVVEHAHALEERDVLEGARNPALGNAARRQVGDVLALERDAPAVGPVEAADHVEQRRLAGAVGPDDREDLAPADLEAHVIDGHHPAEMLGDALDPKLCFVSSQPKPSPRSWAIMPIQSFPCNTSMDSRRARRRNAKRR